MAQAQKIYVNAPLVLYLMNTVLDWSRDDLRVKMPASERTVDTLLAGASIGRTSFGKLSNAIVKGLKDANRQPLRPEELLANFDGEFTTGAGLEGFDREHRKEDDGRLSPAAEALIDTLKREVTLLKNDNERLHLEVSMCWKIINHLHETQHDVRLEQDFVRDLPDRIRHISDVILHIDSFIGNFFLKQLSPGMRAYFAYRLNEPFQENRDDGAPIEALYRFGVSRSGANGKAWQPGLPVGIESNVHRVFTKNEAYGLVDTTTPGVTDPYQRTENEGSVYGVPVRYHNIPVGVLGISSRFRNKKGVTGYRNAADNLGIALSALFYIYGRSLDPNTNEVETGEAIRWKLADRFNDSFRSDQPTVRGV